MKSQTVIEISRELELKLRKNLPEIPHWHFCDNEIDANECVRLVLNGEKRATSPSLWGLEMRNEPLPQVGDLNIVTDWAGEAVCVIETTSVQIVPFCQISEAYAFVEGEGDKSLGYWKEVHWAYYQRELAEFGMQPSEGMPIVCEEFRVVHTANHCKP